MHLYINTMTVISTIALIICIVGHVIAFKIRHERLVSSIALAFLYPMLLFFIPVKAETTFVAPKLIINDCFPLFVIAPDGSPLRTSNILAGHVDDMIKLKNGGKIILEKNVCFNIFGKYVDTDYFIVITDPANKGK